MRIDHLVWYTPHLTQGRHHFASQMDCEPLYGGEHPGEGTANAVLGLGSETYLEILGRDVNQAETSLDPEVRALQGAGLYHWAVGGVDLEALASRAVRAGLTGGALVPGGRLKPDGNRLDWLCWGLHGHDFGALVPFFIDWRGSQHPANAAPRGGRLAGLTLHTPRAAALRQVFDVLGLDIVVADSAVPQVVAELESGKGTTVLKSFTPLPRGYVI